MSSVKRKVLVIENIRRAWLTNIVNTYALIMLLPFYIIARSYGLNGTLLYAALLTLLGSFVAFRLAMIFTRKMLRDLANIRDIKGNIQIVFMVIYGDCAVRWTTLFVPILIFLSLTIDLLPLSLIIKTVLIFVVFFVLIFIFTYNNMRSVVRNIDRLLELVDRK